MSMYQILLEQKLQNLLPHLSQEFIRLRLQEEHQKMSYAFLIFSMMSICDLSIEEAIFSSTEGGDDLGVDGLYLDTSKEGKLNIHIFQSKYRQDSSKNAMGQNEINKTIETIERIINGDEFVRINIRLQDKMKEIIEYTKKLNSLPSYYVHFVSNGKPPSTNDKAMANNFIEGKSTRSVYYYSTEDIFEKIQNIEKKNYEITIFSKGGITDQYISDVRVILTTISAESLIKIYNEGGRDAVLESNIRYFLGNNAINNKIKETILSEKDHHHFAFFNNGVSLVCDYVETEGSGDGNKMIKIENPMIINGGQTTKTIVNVAKDLQKNLNDIFLFIRIYQTKKQSLIEKITEGTNRQNPIFVRDLKSNSHIQNMVKEYFQEKNILLETKRNEYSNIPFDDKREIVKNDTVFQSYLSLYKDLPDEAKSSKTTVFERYFEIIFTEENINLPKEFFRSYQLLAFVQNKERATEINNENSFLLHASLMIIFVMGQISSSLKNSEIELFHEELEKVYFEAISVISSAIHKEQENLGSAYSHNKFFKTSHSVDLIKKLLFQNLP